MSTARDDTKLRDSWRREDNSNVRSRPDRSRRYSRSRSPAPSSHRRETHKPIISRSSEKDFEYRSSTRREPRERSRSKDRSRAVARERDYSPRRPSHRSKDLFDKDGPSSSRRRPNYEYDSPPRSSRHKHSRSPSPNLTRKRKSRRTLSPRRIDNPNSLKPDLFENRRKRSRSPGKPSESKSKDSSSKSLEKDYRDSHRLSRYRSPTSPRAKQIKDSRGRSRSPRVSDRSRDLDRTSRRLSPSSKHRSHRKSPSSVSEAREGKRRESKERSKYRSERHRDSSTRRDRYNRSPSPKRERTDEKHRSRRESPHSGRRRRSRSRDSLIGNSTQRRRRSWDRRSRSPRPSRDSKHKSEMSGMRNISPAQYHSRNGPPSHKENRTQYPPRPAPGYSDADEGMMSNGDLRMRDAYPPPMHRESRPHYQRPPAYASSNSAHSMSPPPPQSPYTNARSWGGSPQYHGPPGQAMQPYPPHPSPGYRQNSYPPGSAPQSPYYSGQSHHTGSYPNSRGGPFNGPYDQNYRGGQYNSHHERRYSGPQYPPRGRGNGGQFTNSHWNSGSAGRGRGQHDSTPDQMRDREVSSHAGDGDEDLFRPSKDLRVEDEGSNDKASSDGKGRESENGQATEPQDKSSKFSFVLKSKTTPTSGPKQDFAAKMRESAGRSKQLDGRPSKPEPRMAKRMCRKLKPRPYLPAEFLESDSVYFRRPGNESVVGSGTYGKVFKAIHVYTNDLVALKKIRMEGERDGFPVTAVREIKLLQSLRHPNVVSLQEVMVEKNDCFMVFEYLSHDLTGLLNHPSFKLEHSHKKHLAKQLFEGLDYLHRRGVLHRDIKAANILVSNEGQLKLADFGLARFFAKRRQLDYTNRVITIWYRSPELLLGETQYGPAVDVWSAACVLIEIFTRHAIFPGDGGEINQLDKIYDILGTPNTVDWPGLVEMQWFQLLRPSKKRPNIFATKYKERVTPAAFELLEAMFQYDPAKRPNAGEVLEHAYFTQEEPLPKQADELRFLDGDWHEFESKALRKENERIAKEARRAAAVASAKEQNREREKEKEKRRASSTAGGDRESKRARPSSTPNGATTDAT